jgi:DNA-binding beta-propeller fold protein YncE
MSSTRSHPKRRRRTALALLAAAFAALCVLAASCGDSKPATKSLVNPTQPKQPALPFPPTANEPATSKGTDTQPAGRVLKIGGRPEGLAVDAKSGALGVALDDRAHDFAILDAATLKVRHTVPLPAGARHVTLWGGKFLVPLENADMLAQVPTTGGEPTYIKTGPHPHNAEAAGNQAFVANEFGDSLTVLRDGKVRATVPVDVQPGGVANVGEGKVLVVSVRAYTVQLLDTTTLHTGPSQNAGYGPSHAVGSWDGRAFVNDTRGGNVLVYETRPRLKFVQRLALGGSPYGIALDSTRNRLWVADSGADKLYEIRTQGKLRVTRTYPTVRQPNTVAVNGDTGAVYIASQATGQLQMITP